jgi:hypothetical protein
MGRHRGWPLLNARYMLFCPFTHQTHREEAVEKPSTQELLTNSNQSGPPFQIGVRREVERSVTEHGWRIVAEEHHWSHPVTGKSGFIDLIGEHGKHLFLLVIECQHVKAKEKKPPQSPSWIFPRLHCHAASFVRLHDPKTA